MATDGELMSKESIPVMVRTYPLGKSEAVFPSAADDSAPEYYNLQGMRIANPEPGRIVICRRGSKAFKIVAGE